MKKTLFLTLILLSLFAIVYGQALEKVDNIPLPYSVLASTDIISLDFDNVPDNALLYQHYEIGTNEPTSLNSNLLTVIEIPVGEDDFYTSITRGETNSYSILSAAVSPAQYVGILLEPYDTGIDLDNYFIITPQSAYLVAISGGYYIYDILFDLQAKTSAPLGTVKVKLTTGLFDSGQNIVGGYSRENIYITVQGSSTTPVANFYGTPTSGTAPLTVQFTDQSTGNITSRSWDFGDGATSTATNPTHTYQSSGTYTVKLSVTGSGGSNTRTRSNYIDVSSPFDTADFMEIASDFFEDDLDSKPRDIYAGCDLDNDGKKEIIVTDYSDGGKVHVYEFNGNNDLQYVWSSNGTNSQYAFPARCVKVGDLDNNGLQEILLPIGRTDNPNEHGLYVFEWDGINDNGYGNGTPISVCPVVKDWTTGYTETIAVDDLDNDGRQEVVYLSSGSSPDRGVFIISCEGYFSSGNVTWIEEASFKQSEGHFSGAPFTSAIGDLDRDGKKEAIIGVWDYGAFLIIESTGVNRYTKRAYFQTTNVTDDVCLKNILITDFDKDGNDDILFNLINQSKIGLIYNITTHNALESNPQVKFIFDNALGGGLGLAYGDQDNNGEQNLFVSKYDHGEIIYLEYSGVGSRLSASSYNVRQLFIDSTGISNGSFALSAPDVDLDGDGLKEITATFIDGDRDPDKKWFRVFEYKGIPQNTEIMVTYPNGGETLDCNFDIQWTSQNISGNVKIEYECDGNWQNIIDNTTDDGLYEWTIPSGTQCNQAKIKISDVADPNIFDESDGTFSINCPDIPNCLLGDVNDDGAITPGDALCAFQIYLGGGTPPPSCDNPCALEAADVNCSPNGITPGDALYIFQAYLAGKTPPLDCDPSTLHKAGNQMQLKLDDASAIPGEQIEVPVHINSASALNAFGLEFGYPSELLTFTGIKSTDVTSGWEAFDAKENEKGIVTIGAYYSKNTIVSKADVLVNVLFTVKEDAAGGGDIWLSNATDDVAEAELINARFSIMNDGVRKPGDIPSSYALEQNYPNPFNMHTEIIYELPESDHVTVTIYNSLGHEIRTLVSRSHEAGRYATRWNGKDNQGVDATSGIYIYRLQTNRFSDSKKMLLVK